MERFCFEWGLLAVWSKLPLQPTVPTQAFPCNFLDQAILSGTQISCTSGVLQLCSSGFKRILCVIPMYCNLWWQLVLFDIHYHSSRSSMGIRNTGFSTSDTWISAGWCPVKIIHNYDLLSGYSNTFSSYTALFVD